MADKAEPEAEDYGFGTDQAVDRIEKLLTSDDSDRDTVMINVRTLMRNRNRTDVRSETLMNEAVEDMERIAGRFADVLYSGDRVTPVLVFYTADYKKVIPKNFLRPVPASRASYDVAAKGILNRISNEKTTVNGLPVITQVLSPVHKIYSELSRLAGRIKTGQNIIMLSHVNCDYHISDRYPNMQLVDSFTGKIRTPGQFAEKIYDTSAVPFCPPIHAVLGDEELIKPVYTRDEKRRLLEQAEKEHWAYKTGNAIKTRMRRSGWLDPKVRYPLI